MSEWGLLSKILVGINCALLLAFIAIGARGGYVILVLFFIPLITIYFERRWKSRFEEKRIWQIRVILNIANLIVLIIFIYNVYLIWLIFSLLFA